MGPNGSLLDDKSVVFVLGGPGCGKGTQCAKIVEHFGYIHLSAGDLLRAEQKSGSENGTMIQNMIKDGKIVPAEVTIKLLQRALNASGNNKFLIDGFPRDEVNRAAFEKVTGIEPAFVLFFYCSEEEMEKRLLARNQGREDDNIETIRKRFRVFLYSSIPVVNYYTLKGKVHKIDANKSVDEVFEAVKAVFTSSETKEMQVYRHMKMRAEELKAEYVKALESVKKDGAVEIEDDEDVKADEDVQGDEDIMADEKKDAGEDHKADEKMDAGENVKADEEEDADEKKVEKKLKKDLEIECS